MSPVFPNGTTAAGNFTGPAVYIEPRAGEAVWARYLVVGVTVGVFVVGCVKFVWTWKDRRAKKAKKAAKKAKKAAKKAAKRAARSAAAGIDLGDMSANTTRPMQAHLGSPVNGHPVDLRRVMNVQTYTESARTGTRNPGTATSSVESLPQSDVASMYYTPRNSVTQLGEGSQRSNIVDTTEGANMTEMGLPKPTHAEADIMA